MKLSLVFYSIFLSIFSTSVMTYITLATPIGPWMGPTLALLALVLFRPFVSSHKELILPVCAGSLGGIVATAVSFSFPTIYFLDKNFFDSFIMQPQFFLLTLIGLIMSSGGVGLFLAYYCAPSLIDEQNLSFPIGKLEYKVLSAEHSSTQKKHLGAGLFTTIVYGLLGTPLFFKSVFIPARIKLFSAYNVLFFSFPEIIVAMNIVPMLIAIGFIAGHMITLPLLIGAFSKIVLIDPFYGAYYSHLKDADFLFAFCSGMVLSGAFLGVFTFFQQIYALFKKLGTEKKIVFDKNKFITPEFFLLLSSFLFLYILKFSFVSKMYIVLFSMVCAYQIAVIAGKIGLALLGRFATFVMIPGVILFDLSALQITILATFVELVGGIMTDALFGYRAALEAGIERVRVRRYQLLGLCVSALVCAVTFYFLVTYFQLGSEQLFAQRAQARALLIHVTTFDYYVLAYGAFFGIVLKKLKINPMLVLGGLLMPPSLSLMLMIGGVLSLVVKNKETY
ncbi:hypothetical protein K9K77_00430, partial [Candidatus Babeliales bacterium]|nr:hypothetical protein [Candidatus Babeliales bacterium]